MAYPLEIYLSLTRKIRFTNLTIVTIDVEVVMAVQSSLIIGALLHLKIAELSTSILIVGFDDIFKNTNN